MEKLIEKLYLKDFQRICIINAEEDFISAFRAVRPAVRIDERIDARYLYNFILIFATSSLQVDDLSNRGVHNLYEDGILWFAYPRNGTGHKSNLTKEQGWDMLKTLGFKAVRHIIINDRWNGIRFRNSRFVRSRLSLKEK